MEVPQSTTSPLSTIRLAKGSDEHCKLWTSFGKVLEIEAIEETWIIPNDLSMSFIDRLRVLLGPPAV
jgi:hypothetical protein